MNFTSHSARAEWFRLHPRGSTAVASALCGGSTAVEASLGKEPGAVILSSVPGSGCEAILAVRGQQIDLAVFRPDPGRLASSWASHLDAACSLGALWGQGGEGEMAEMVGFDAGLLRYGSHVRPPAGPDEDAVERTAQKFFSRALDVFWRAQQCPAWRTPSPAVEEIAARAATNLGIEDWPLAEGSVRALDVLGYSAAFSGDRVRVADPRLLHRLQADFGLRGGQAGSCWVTRAAARFRAVAPWPTSPDGKLWLPPGDYREERSAMPQIDEDHFDDFLAFCKDKGILSDRLPIPCGLLKSGQKTIDPRKAIRLSKTAKLDELLSRTLVSEDGVLLDGHHRWAALVILGDPAALVNCVKLHAPFPRCLELAREFLGTDPKDGSAAFAASTEKQLVSLAKKLRKEFWLDGYGSLWWNPRSKEVYYTTCDGTENDEAKEIQKKLDDVQGVEKVHIVSEAPPPDGQGWVRLFPDGSKFAIELAPDGRTVVNFALGMSPPGQYVPDGYDWRSGPGSEEDYGDGDETGRMIRMLKRRFKRSFGEDQRAAARDLLASLDDDQAIDVYRGLIKGGRDPADAEEAAWKLYRVLARQDNYDGPDSPASFRHLLSEWHPGVVRARAMAGSAKDSILVRRAFGSSWHALDKSLRAVLAFSGRLDGTTPPDQRTYLEVAIQGYRDANRAALESREQARAAGAKSREALAVSLEPLEKPLWKVNGDTSHLAFTQALRWVQRLVAAKGGETGHVEVDVRIDPESRRSVFDQPGSIVLCPMESPRGCCHLLGHVLERQLAGAKHLCSALLKFRTHGEVASDMGMTTGGMALQGELGRLGGFDAAFRGIDGWYAGKKNPAHEGTEILAMGLEACWEDAAVFAAGDPEFFLTVIGILTGDLRGEWPPRED